MDNSASSQRPTAAQVLLGLFVAWQFFFLLAANYVGLLPHGQPEEGELSDSRDVTPPPNANGPLQRAIDYVGVWTTCWSQLTGQYQAWWLFAPTFPDQATFPVVELRWQDDRELADAVAGFSTPLAAADDLTCATLWAAFQSSAGPPPVRSRTRIEPANPQNYFRPPSSFDRLFHYEARLGLIFTGWNKQSVHDHPGLWQELVEDRVRRQWKSMQAYLRWHMTRFHEAHPELPAPKQAILLIRLYPTPRPGQPRVWQDPVEQPLARWQPAARVSPHYLPVEMCDPVTGRFVRVRARD